MRSSALAATVAYSFVATIATLGAQVTSATPSFEVAAVRQSRSGGEFATFRAEPSGWLNVTNVSLRDLILRAFELQPFELVDGPRWIDVERYDIVARAETEASPAQLNAMMQSLLVDRFKLVIAREKREIPIYNLTLARSDGALGARLTRSSEACDATGRPLSPRPAGIPVLPATLSKGVVTGCRLLRTPGWIMGAGQPMSAFANTLTQHLRRPVRDHTELPGLFGFSLSFMPEERPGGFAELPSEFPAVAPDAPVLFTALQEQLGLRLQAARELGDVRVIASVERPVTD